MDSRRAHFSTSLRASKPSESAIASAVRGQLAIEQVKADAKLRKRRNDAARILDELKLLPVTGPLLSDDDLYDAEGLPK